LLTQEILQNKKILIVAAHPDDELLGLGATMHKLIKSKSVETRVIILGEGITSRSDKRDEKMWKKELEIHHKNIEDARLAIGYGEVKTHNLPDNRFDTVPLLDIIKIVEKEKENFKPDVIFTHHSGDLNIDHQRTFAAALTAARPMAGETVQTIITFETPSATEWNSYSDSNQFSPNLFFEVSEEDINAKIRGMESYQFEKREYPHPRSPEALKYRARYWGLTVGVAYAEAFNVVRSIIR
jgi:LmbE family N-acetylglucosaminyl deacetylase